MNYKRKKSKRRVRCTVCTKYRWMGNSEGRFKKQMKRSNSRTE